MFSPSRVMWAVLASGHMASFDRSKCTGPLNGPTATGQHCPEGWTFYQESLPQIQGATSPGRAEAAYRRSDLFERRRRVMEDWAAYLAGETLEPEAAPMQRSLR